MYNSADYDRENPRNTNIKSPLAHISMFPSKVFSDPITLPSSHPEGSRGPVELLLTAGADEACNYFPC